MLKTEGRGLKFFRGWRLAPIVDWVGAVVPIILSIFGILVLYSFRANSPRLFIDQSIYTIIGIIIMILLTIFDYRNVRPITFYLFVLVTGLLIVVQVVGSTVFGAKRWLDLGIFQLQPSELAKIVTILIMAICVPRIAQHKQVAKYLILALATSFFMIMLILIQPDLGTASVLVVICIGLLAYAQLSKRIVLALCVVTILAIPIGYRNLRPYQQQRLMTFLNPSKDPAGSGYNVTQSMIAVGSGGIWGRGLGQGSQSQLQFLPVAHTDFIFAGLSEAFGFIGSSILLLLLLALIWRALTVSAIAQDSFGQMIGLGAAIMWFYQSMTNIAMNIGLLPVTGVPLPFVSYGGTAIIINYLLVGLLQSIYLRHKKIRFS